MLENNKISNEKIITKVINEENNSYSFASWLNSSKISNLSPSKLSNTLSLFWNSKKGKKNLYKSIYNFVGVLVKNNSSYQFLERRGSSRNTFVWKGYYKTQGRTIKFFGYNKYFFR